MKQKTRFICFASFKGGVGRSLALANSAHLLARSGRKVLIIDFDLEAPGQHLTDLFFQKSRPGPGLIDLIHAFRDHVKNQDETPFPWDVTSFIQRSATFDQLADERLKSPRHEDWIAGGELWLMRAGGPDLLDRLGQLNWSDFYVNSRGALFFEALKAELRQRQHFDDVLLDARTGFSDVFMISTLVLADTVVMVTGMQRQHMSGLRDTFSILSNAHNEELYGKKRLLIVLSPAADLHPVEFNKREDEIRQEWPEFPGFDLRIPYQSALFMRESILAFEEDRVPSSGGSGNYVSHLKAVVDALNGAPLVHERQKEQATNPFSIIRTDYRSVEDWGRYFVDPGGRVLEAASAFMPTIVTGSRGSGKTMLARQLSYETMLARFKSEGRKPVPEQIDCIGLYFRLDQDVIKAFDTREGDLKEQFDRLFSQFLDLKILHAALEALDRLGGLAVWLRDRHHILFVQLFRELGSMPSLTPDFSTLHQEIELRFSEIRVYLNNPRSSRAPFNVQPNILMKILTEFLIREGRFGNTYFTILIDEYENFREYQQKALNARMKQAKQADRFTYKFFARSNGMRTYETLSQGQLLQNPHDFRSYSLDEDTSFDQFRDHIRKVINKHLDNSSYFRNRGRTDITDILEDIGPVEEAIRLVGRRRGDELAQWVQRNHSTATAAILLDWYTTEADPLRQATATVIVNQGKDASQVVASFRAWDQKARDWHHNYHRGALFWLCTLYSSRKLYCGFSDIVGLAGGNVRTALELCFQIVEDWLTADDLALPISADIQTNAIRKKAQEYRELIRTADSSNVHQMLIFAERLGRLFETIHKSPRQSEPEKNHFNIKGVLSIEAQVFIDQCYAEEILRRLSERKQKSKSIEKQDSWQLHPRLAPLFDISWRRIKNIELDTTTFEILWSGSEQEWTALQKGYETKGRKVGRDTSEVQHHFDV